MKRYGSPIWIFLADALPQAALAALLLAQHTAVERIAGISPLAAGIACAALAAGAAGYGIVRLARGKPVALWYYIAQAAVSSAMLTVVLISYVNRTVFEAGRSELAGLAAALICPALLRCLICSVFELTPAERKARIWVQLVVTLSIPLLWYVAGSAFLSLTGFLMLDGFEQWAGIAEIAAVALAVASLLVFLFFLMRLLVLAMRRKPKAWQWLRFPILILLPQIGLLINNFSLAMFSGSLENPSYLFGDFSHPAFYILAALNALFMLLPDFQAKNLRLLLFYGRCVTFTYILYFFLVFLPLLPLSVLGTLLFGLGLLILTPAILTVMHVRTLADDMRYLRQSFNAVLIAAVFASGVLLLPAGLFFSYSLDRGQLAQAVQYVYGTDYGSAAPAGLDARAVARSLKNARQHMPASRFGGEFLVLDNTPYLSSIYQAYVLGGKSLPGERIEELERIFVGTAGNTEVDREMQAVEVWDGEVDVTRVLYSTEYDNAAGCYVTDLDIELKNSSGFDNVEFATRFRLPEGAWIGGFYLDIAGERKRGMLADKRAATELYNEIVSRERDPGILHYNGDGRIEFRVFPFFAGETRRSGFTVMHRQPLAFTLAGKEIRIDVPPMQDSAFVGGGMAYIPASVKRDLTRVLRPARHCFIADFSGPSRSAAQENLTRIERYIRANGIPAEDCEVLLANYAVTKAVIGPDDSIDAGNTKAAGGFYLERAVKEVLYTMYLRSTGERPVIIVSTDDIRNAVMDGLPGMGFAHPDCSRYYVLGDDGKLLAYSLEDNAHIGAADAIAAESALAWPDAENPLLYLPDDGRDTLALLPGDGFDPYRETARTWEGALHLMGLKLYAELYPANYKAASFRELTGSISTGILTASSAYTVLETREQELELERMHEEYLNAGAAMQEPIQLQNMPEPPIWLLAIPILGIAAARAIYRKY